jgi:hypothetical protein
MSNSLNSPSPSPLGVDTTEEHSLPTSEIYTVGSPIANIEPGDIIFFTRKRIHALIRAADDYTDDATTAPFNPSHVDVIWLDGYDTAFRTRSIRRETLESMATDNRIRLIDEGIPNVKAINRAPGVRNPERHQRDSTVQPGPRLPVSNLSFERTYSLNLVNGFLKHPIVDHKQGRVQKAKAMFLARRPDGRIAAVTTINSVNARMAFDRETVEITRYASHPETPNHGVTNNTATWMLGRVCQWAALEGYERVRSLAGTDGNNGQIYEAANFTFDGTAETSGAYNRDGRNNQSHSATLKRYIRTVDVDSENASDGLPRRFESRLEANDETRGDATTLTEFQQNQAETTPSQFKFTREEATDYKFTHGDTSENYNVFSDELKSLINETNAPIALSELEESRGRHTPAAVFGAAIGDELIAAMIVSGNPRDKIPTARIDGYAAKDTEYPDATVRWLLTRVRDWCDLQSYVSVSIPPQTFDHVNRVNNTVPAGVGFTKQNNAYHYPDEKQQFASQSTETHTAVMSKQ